MLMKDESSRRWFGAGLGLIAMLVTFAVNAGKFLVIDAPEPSDVIVVLAGETDCRPARALQLMEQGYGRRELLDVPATARIYEFAQSELAQKYIQDLPGKAIGVCLIEGLSTRDESRDVEKCLAQEDGSRVLIVTFNGIDQLGIEQRSRSLILEGFSTDTRTKDIDWQQSRRVGCLKGHLHSY